MTFQALLQGFFVDRLVRQRCASGHTIAAYRDTFRLLLRFATARLHKPPSRLSIEDLDASFLSEFLDHLEHKRSSCEGKGRKTRCTPLRRDVARVLDAWLREQPVGAQQPVFLSSRGGPLSRDAIESLVAKHLSAARKTCASLKEKNITPHTLRHTAAMELLRCGVDRSVIALWLGHESMETTQIYLHADMRLKEQALARTTNSRAAPTKYRPKDDLLAFLEGL